MIKIWSLKKEAGNKGDEDKKKTKVSAAQIRVQKELDLPKTMKIHFPAEEDLLNFELTIIPDEGGKFHFTFKINGNYPHDPPKIYHPNIDLTGKVCLNILREDWKPVLNLTSIMVGLQFLFLEPNPDDPLNKDAANVFRADKNKFERQVKESMTGYYVDNEKFDKVI